MSKQFSSDLKMKAVKYYHKVDNYSKVCKIFECSERSSLLFDVLNHFFKCIIIQMHTHS